MGVAHFGACIWILATYVVGNSRWWPQMVCFHIRWFDSTLDWECHNTRAEAELVAQQLTQFEEGFWIEEYEDSQNTLPCPYRQISRGR
jgi:hypothetical protein